MINPNLILNLKEYFKAPYLDGSLAWNKMMPTYRRSNICDFSNFTKASVIICLYLKNNKWIFPFIKRVEDGLPHGG